MQKKGRREGLPYESPSVSHPAHSSPPCISEGSISKFIPSLKAIYYHTLKQSLNITSRSPVEASAASAKSSTAAKRASISAGRRAQPRCGGIIALASKKANGILALAREAEVAAT